jgi:hypothetical protein
MLRSTLSRRNFWKNIIRKEKKLNQNVVLLVIYVQESVLGSGGFGVVFKGILNASFVVDYNH